MFSNAGVSSGSNPYCSVHAAYGADDILAPADIVREKIARSPGWLG